MSSFNRRRFSLTPDLTIISGKDESTVDPIQILDMTSYESDIRRLTMKLSTDQKDGQNYKESGIHECCQFWN